MNIADKGGKTIYFNISGILFIKDLYKGEDYMEYISRIGVNTPRKEAWDSRLLVQQNIMVIQKLLIFYMLKCSQVLMLMPL